MNPLEHESYEGPEGQRVLEAFSNAINLVHEAQVQLSLLRLLEPGNPLIPIGTAAFDTLSHTREGEIKFVMAEDPDPENRFISFVLRSIQIDKDDDESLGIVSPEMVINVDKIAAAQAQGVDENELHEAISEDLVVANEVASAYFAGRIADNGFIATYRAALQTQHAYLRATYAVPLIPSTEIPTLTEETIVQTIKADLGEDDMWLVDTRFAAFQTAAYERLADLRKVQRLASPEDEIISVEQALATPATDTDDIDLEILAAQISVLEAVVSDNPDLIEGAKGVMMQLLSDPYVSDQTIDKCIQYQQWLMAQEEMAERIKKHQRRIVRPTPDTLAIHDERAIERLERMSTPDREKLVAELLVSIWLDEFVTIEESIGGLPTDMSPEE